MTAVNVDGELCIAERGATLWGLRSPSVAAQGYAAINPMPPGAVNPYRSSAFLPPFAGNMGDLTLGATTAYTMLFQLPPIPTTTTWTGIKIHMAGRVGSPIAPSLVAVALCNGGDRNNPTLNGGAVTWITGTSLVAPPAGTDLEPGVGPVCAELNVPSQAGARMLCVRIQMPAGTHTGAGVNGGGVGTDTTTYPIGVSTPNSQGSIVGNVGTGSGWGEAFGQVPWFMIEYTGLSTPVLQMWLFGDSWTQGYISVGSNGNRGPFGALEGSSLWSTRPNINFVNFGRMGHTTAQISARMRKLMDQFDVGSIGRQDKSINDHDANFDVTTTISDASWATLQGDYSYVAGAGKLFIPYTLGGSNGWASGWFTRFLSHQADAEALFGVDGVGGVYDQSVVLNADGSIKTGKFTGDGSHLLTAAQLEQGEDMWPSFASVLAAKGHSV